MIGETNINGGSGLNGKGALLKIKAYTGSTIVVSKDSYSKQIKDCIVLDNEYSYWYFKTSDYGTWTITATDGTDTASDTVLVTANEEYNVTLIYQLILYNSGNTYDYPWRIVKQGYNVVLPTGETLKCGPYAGGGNIYPGGGFVIDQKIDLSNYSTLYAHFVLNTMAYTSKVCVFASSTYTGANQIYKVLVENKTTDVLASTIVTNTDPSLLDDGIISCNISNLQGEAYINVGGRCTDTRSSMVFEVDRVWLEV